VVAVVAVVVALVANLVIVRRLDREVDARLMGQLEQAVTGTSAPLVVTPGGDHDSDLDDAPTFIWRVSPAGEVTALMVGAPPLPRHDWSGGSTTATTGGSTFRFTSTPTDGGWLVAGESIVRIGQIRGDLIVVELALGALLLVVTFTGSFIVGLRASAPIEEIRRRQAEFTADASHELRTPLSVIQAEVDLALSKSRDPTSYRATLERVASESWRLRSIVDDLLWLARHDADAPSAVVGSVTDVRAVARRCAERFEAVAVAGAVELVHSTEPGPAAPVLADPDAIDRLVSVLLDNACRYAGQGGRVELQVTCSGGQVTLIVDDSGPGIPAGQHDLVLDRFHRADDRPGGTGLGLAIADAVVRSSGGTWSIGRSRLGGAHMGVSWRTASGHDLDTGTSEPKDATPAGSTVIPTPADRR
jgi:signal transduction histidine kinase